MNQYSYDLLGVRVVLKCNAAELRTPLENLYAAFPKGHNGRTGKRADVSYTLFKRNGGGRHPSSLGISEGEQILHETEDEESLLLYLDWFIHQELLQRLAGYYQIHAGVVSRNGQGVILAGPSGSGKTTLVTGLLQKGYRYLSDEVALIDPKTLQVHPFPRRLHVPREDLPLFSPAGDGSTPPMRKTKYGAEIPVPLQQVGLPGKVACVIFPTFAGAFSRPELIPISKGDALLNLVKSSLNFQRHGEAGIDTLMRLVGKAACFKLETGGLKETASLISGLLEEN